MKTENLTVYHCISCGSIVHSGLETPPPQCCGQAMAQAIAETIPTDVDAVQPSDVPVPESPKIKDREKPR